MDTARVSVVSSTVLDGVSVSAVEWGLIGRRLLSVMSGGETPPRPWIESQTSVSPVAYSKVSEETENSGGGEDVRERRKLKNEDSSYDSDFEPCETSTSPRGEFGHEDVSRTTSETLGAEFEDYVTHTPLHIAARPTFVAQTSVNSSIATSCTIGSNVRTTTGHHVPLSAPSLTITEPTPQPCSILPVFPFVPTTISSTSSSVVVSKTDGTTTQATTVASQSKISTTTTTTTAVEDELISHSLADVVESADYPQQVEFGVKLGYSEHLVQLALAKLGVKPNKNELLDELIRLGAGAPRSDCEEDTIESEEIEQPALRQIIIDGSNVAMSHGNKIKFSCKGIRLCVDWFRSRGHKEITVFVPLWRKEQSRLDAIITDQDVLLELEKEGVISFTPSRSCGGKRIVSYDDRYILKEAIKSEGVVVSNDNYRDLATESAAFRKVVETSLLMYSWVNGRFEPPDDPLGRNGPSLDVFLRKLPSGAGSSSSSTVVKDSRPCPYGRKCTYGNKCKYMHPERGTAPVKSVTEILHEQKQKHYQDKAKSRDSSPGENLRAKSLSFPVCSSESSCLINKKPLARTQSTFPAISSPQIVTSKDGNSEFSSKLSPCPLDSSSCSTVHGTVQTVQDSLSPLCTSILKDDSSHFTLGSQLGFHSNLQWSGHESAQTNQASKISLSFSSHVSDSDVAVAENLHPKLARQLSINPVGDDRLSKLSNFKGNQSGDLTNFMSSLSIQQQQQQQQSKQKQQILHQQRLQPQKSINQQPPPSHRLLESETLSSRQCIGTRCISPGPSFSHAYGNRDLMPTYFHPQLTRHSSAQETKQLSPYSQHMLPPCFHNPVGRNLSAPDQIRGGGQQHHQNIIPHITRVNSTSDSRLNMHGGSSSSESQRFSSDSFDDSYLGRLPCSHIPLSTIGANSPGPIGSRPLSPQQPHAGMMMTQSGLSSNTRVPQHLTQSSNLRLPLSLPPGGSNTHEDERLKIFYHLSQLFPEDQVRGALARNPDETNPREICMSILSMTGCRSAASPQEMTSGGISLSGLGGGLSLLNTSPFPTPTSHESARDAARRAAYSHLIQLFPEENVRNILIRYPEETDAQNLCSLLIDEIKQS